MFKHNSRKILFQKSLLDALKTFLGPLFLLFFIFSSITNLSLYALEDLRISPPSPSDKALTAYESGYASYRNGNFEEAEQHLLEAIKNEPNLLKAHYWLGKIYKEQGRLDDAVAHWNEVEKLIELIINRRNALIVGNNEYPAQVQIEKAQEAIKGAQEAYEKGMYFLNKGHWHAAETMLREAVSLYPAEKSYLIALARVLWDSGKKKASAYFYRDLLEHEDIKIETFIEGIEKILKLEMKHIAIPLVIKHKERFSSIGAFQKILTSLVEQPQITTVSLGTIIERHDGLVVLNVGLMNGLSLSDEYSLKLRAFKPGRKIVDLEVNKEIGHTKNERTADLLITKISQNSSWALIQREFGSGVKVGDLIEIQ